MTYFKNLTFVKQIGFANTYCTSLLNMGSMGYIKIC